MPPKPAIALIPRTTSNCLDLAVVYFGRNYSVLFGMWMLVALPAALLVYFLTRWWELDWRFAIATVYFSSLALSVLVINDAVPRLFTEADGSSEDEPRSSRGLFGATMVLVILGVGGGLLIRNMGDAFGLTVSLQRIGVATGFCSAGVALLVQSSITVGRYQHLSWSMARAFYLGLSVRSLAAVGPALVLFPPESWVILLGLILCIWPGAWVLLRTGFNFERTCLNRIDPNWQATHVKKIVRSEGADLIARAFWTNLFWLGLTALAFVTLDAMISLLFQVPIFFGRAFTAELSAGRALELLRSDPLVLTTLTATALLTWPLARIAWLFTYLDIRVRRDCWDLQFRMAEESQRLRTQGLAR
ncbi:hypothetical protein [Thalassoroseus pseudoceratinae]|uniref:hypothetical protein n=1 Tax=Thalassoroseus pseudoceratinae TaxID=2713176 RepID=UPI001422511A|nr:hypothetical protein [Thalassoroseus pseudoceratinae]